MPFHRYETRLFYTLNECPNPGCPKIDVSMIGYACLNSIPSDNIAKLIAIVLTKCEDCQKAFYEKIWPRLNTPCQCEECYFRYTCPPLENQDIGDYTLQYMKSTGKRGPWINYSVYKKFADLFYFQ